MGSVSIPALKLELLFENMYTFKFVVGLEVVEVEGLLDTFQGIDVSKSETSIPDHKSELLSKIRSTWGIKRTNKELVEGLSNALVCCLRWGGQIRGSSTLVIMLLKVNLGNPQADYP